MNIKVFGGAGFIGNHLIKHLAGRGHRVTVCDIRKPKITGANVTDPTGEKASWYNPITVRECDVISSADVYWAIDKGDTVINLAAVSTFTRCNRHPDLATAVNVTGAANIATACIRNHAAHLIYTSTGSVYSIGAIPPIRESSPVRPVSIYGLTKLWAENIQHKILHDTAVKLTILRLPHVVGAGKTWGANSIILKLMNNEQPVIYGDGEQKNDFTCVDDVVQAITLAAEKQVDGLYNIGTGVGRTVNEFFEWSRRLLGKPDITPVYTAPRAEDFGNFYYDITPAKEKLGYSPKYKLEETLEKTIREWEQWL